MSETTPNTDIVQFIIPDIYVNAYHRLLNLMVSYGLDLLKDCKAGCNAKNRKLIECWNIFQSACAAYNIEQPRASEVLFNFVVEQINILYGETIPSEVVEIRSATDEEIDDIIDD